MAPKVTAKDASNVQLRIASFPVRVIDFLQDALAARVIGPACIRQAELAGAALHQADAEVRFDCGHMLASHRGGKPETSCGATQAALFNCRNKYGHAGETLPFDSTIIIP
jgi:hypothetical protein